MGAYHIILADDHPMFRNGIKRIIENSNGLSVAGEADDGLQLLELLKKNNPIWRDLRFAATGFERMRIKGRPGRPKNDGSPCANRYRIPIPSVSGA